MTFSSSAIAVCSDRQLSGISISLRNQRKRPMNRHCVTWSVDRSNLIPAFEQQIAQCEAARHIPAYVFSEAVTFIEKF
jgi:hypothetical protein